MHGYGQGIYESQNFLINIAVNLKLLLKNSLLKAGSIVFFYYLSFPSQRINGTLSGYYSSLPQTKWQIHLQGRVILMPRIRPVSKPEP